MGGKLDIIVDRDSSFTSSQIPARRNELANKHTKSTKKDLPDYVNLIKSSFKMDMGRMWGEIFVREQYGKAMGTNQTTFGGEGELFPAETGPTKANVRGQQRVRVSYTLGAQTCGKTTDDFEPWMRKRVGALHSQLVASLQRIKLAPDGGFQAMEKAVEAAEDEFPDEIIPEDRVAKQEMIAFHESEIAILEKNLGREQEELNRTKDDDRREALEFRIRNIRANIQVERDRIATLQTGEIVNTRTEMDDYLRDQFVANIQSNQARMQVTQRQLAEAQRLAALLPAGEADKAREFVERQLTADVIAKGDTEKTQKVIDALGKKVEGYYQGAVAQQEAAQAERAIMLLNGMTQAGNIAVTFVGGNYAAAAYAGLTGYQSGGAIDGIKGAASWYSTGGYVVAEAIDGYMKGGYLSKGGVTGAVEKAAEAAILGKLFEYGLNKVGVATGIFKKPATREELKQRLKEFQATPEEVKQRLQEFRAIEGVRTATGLGLNKEQFKREMETGKKLVAEFQAVEKEFQAAVKASAPPSQIGELSRKANEKAKMINGSFYAKNNLKNLGGDIEKQAFARMEKLYLQVDSRTKALLAQEHQWSMNKLKFKEFRNASSKGKIGMDRDWGVIEEGALFIKNGRRSSVHELQKDGREAYKKAYEEVFGQSYEKSFQEFTTRAHSESFRDLGVLNDLRDPKNVQRLQKMWGEQTARTIEFKGLHMLNDPKLKPHLSNIERYIESGRGLSKEIEKKILPMLKNAKPGKGLSAAGVDSSGKHLSEIKAILDDMTSYRIDPVTASEKLRLQTGGLDLPEVLDQMRNLTEAMFKVGGLGRK